MTARTIKRMPGSRELIAGHGKDTMETTLVIMAAGMGSRFGSGIKQLAEVGPGGEIIMDYSIYAAKEAGFDNVVFIIRRDIEEAFRLAIGDRIEKYIPVKYVYQELENLPEGYSVPEGRGKPWGTGHAILSCLGKIDNPFLVINADDYYGKEAFRALHEYLVNLPEDSRGQYCMAGFVLGNTLSDNGKVTRGACVVEDGLLTGVEEMFDLRREGDVVVGRKEDGTPVEISPESTVSMNFWGFTPDFLPELEGYFKDFLDKEASVNPLKSEFLLPSIVGSMIEEGRAKVAVLPTNDRWFGVTYAEDKPVFMKCIRGLIAAGVYPEATFR